MTPHAIAAVSHLTAFASDGRWMGQDYVLALIAATFPAWTLLTLVRGWFRGETARCAAIAAPAPVRSGRR